MRLNKRLYPAAPRKLRAPLVSRGRSADSESKCLFASEAKTGPAPTARVDRRRRKKEQEIPVPDDQLNAAAEGIEDAVRRSTVGVVCGSGSKKGQGIGTGTLVRWKGHHLILTAEHVISDTIPGDLRFFFPQDAPPTNVDRETLLHLKGVPTSGLRPFTEIQLGPLAHERDLDLAIMPVKGGLEIEYHLQFFDLTPGGRTPPEGQTIIVTGFPHDLSRVTYRKDRVVFTYTE
jgi:hypothetical protein